MRLRSNVMYFFVPQLFRALVGISVLPVTTMVLDAADFGVFALYTAISNFCAGIVFSGLMYSISNDFLKSSHENKKKIVTSLMVFGFILSTFISALIYPLFFLLSNAVGYDFLDDNLYFWVVIISIFLSPVWTLASSIIIVEGNFPVFAVVSVLETIFSVGVTIISLFVLDFGRESLFYGTIASLVVSFLGAIWFLSGWMILSINQKFLIQHAKVCGRSLPSSILEKVRNPFQSLLFAKYVGTQFVGVFNHSQQYMNMTRMMVKSFANALWRPALIEAREGGDFDFVLRCWQCVYFFLTMSGVFFATVGRDVVGMLTNYKMVEAHWLAAFWMVVLLVEHTGRAELAIIYDRGLVAASEVMLLISFAVSLLFLVVLVPIWGMIGGVGAALMSPIVHRTLLVLYVRRVHKSEFREWSALMGVGIVCGSVGVSFQAASGLTTNVSLFLLFSASVIILFRKSIIWGVRTLVPEFSARVLPKKK